MLDLFFIIFFQLDCLPVQCLLHPYLCLAYLHFLLFLCLNPSVMNIFCMLRNNLFASLESLECIKLWYTIHIVLCMIY